MFISLQRIEWYNWWLRWNPTSLQPLDTPVSQHEQWSRGISLWSQSIPQHCLGMDDPWFLLIPRQQWPMDLWTRWGSWLHSSSRSIHVGEFSGIGASLAISFKRVSWIMRIYYQKFAWIYHAVRSRSSSIGSDPDQPGSQSNQAGVEWLGGRKGRGLISCRAESSYVHFYSKGNLFKVPYGKNVWL